MARANGANMLATIIILVLGTAAFRPFSCCAMAVPGSLANHTEDLLDAQDKIVGPDAFFAGSAAYQTSPRNRRRPGRSHPSVRDTQYESNSLLC